MVELRPRLDDKFFQARQPDDRFGETDDMDLLEVEFLQHRTVSQRTQIANVDLLQSRVFLQGGFASLAVKGLQSGEAGQGS